MAGLQRNLISEAGGKQESARSQRLVTLDVYKHQSNTSVVDLR